MKLVYILLDLGFSYDNQYDIDNTEIGKNCLSCESGTIFIHWKENNNFLIMFQGEGFHINSFFVNINDDNSVMTFIVNVINFFNIE